jgi:dTDP-4-dehydrorhamnose reductase
VNHLGPVVVTGAGGRLGSALVGLLTERHPGVVGWRRPEYDLDSTDPARLLDRDRPSLVIHAAAWTDVDGCAREPELSMRRNAEAVGTLADACASRGVGLFLVSTNEVFDGTRDDGAGYAEVDTPRPGNAYGVSKLAGEEAARTAFAEAPRLWIARTAWLYGPPGSDFPAKIIAASDRLGDSEALPVVTDETGSPTFTHDLARAILDLVAASDSGGLFHLVNAGAATRFDWAEAVLQRCRPDRTLRPISSREFVRASVPPSWGVLDCTRATGYGVRLRDWRDALGDYLDSGC